VAIGLEMDVFPAAAENQQYQYPPTAYVHFADDEGTDQVRRSAVPQAPSKQPARVCAGASCSCLAGQGGAAVLGCEPCRRHATLKFPAPHRHLRALPAASPPRLLTLCRG
jgi:hypothetical protein